MVVHDGMIRDEDGCIILQSGILRCTVNEIEFTLESDQAEWKSEKTLLGLQRNQLPEIR